MTGLSKITDKILAEARADAAKTLAEADARCSEISGEYARRGAEIRKRIETEARANAAEIVSRAKSSEAMIRRNQQLEARSRQIDRAFELAKREMLNLSDDRYLEMLLMLLGSALKRQLEDEASSLALYGEAEEAPVERYEVLLNEHDRERLGGRLMEEFGKRFGSSLPVDRVVLAEGTVAIDGGLVLRCGSMEINCSVKALVEEIRPELEAKVSRKLFPEKKGS